MATETSPAPVELAPGKYKCILADPPWSYATYSNKGKGRSAEAHYDSMPLDAIKALPVGRWAAADCVLLLWISKPLLLRAFEVISAWGFEFKTIAFTWVKILDEPPLRFHFGMGHWTRSNPEICLLATRGHPHRLHADVGELLLAPRREHSVKPDEIYGLIERLLAGPFLELFASAAAPHREGWTRWVGKDRASARRWPSSGCPGAEDPR